MELTMFLDSEFNSQNNPDKYYVDGYDNFRLTVFKAKANGITSEIIKVTIENAD